MVEEGVVGEGGVDEGVVEIIGRGHVLGAWSGRTGTATWGKDN